MLTMEQTPWAPEILAEGAGILDLLSIKWWLSAGTILGIYRDGKLIPHDTDLDVGAQEPLDHEVTKSAFFERGFEAVAFSTFQLAFRKREVIFDIYLFEKVGENLVCEITKQGKMAKPYRLFEKLGTLQFEGKFYPTPQPVEEYLRVRYGDWQTPKTEKVDWMEEAHNFVKS